METKYHITDKEIEEISTKAEILKQYDKEFVRAVEEWKANGGYYPTDKGKRLRKELACYGIAKTEILKQMIDQPGADPEEIQRVINVIKISGVDMYGTDLYDKIPGIDGSKQEDELTSSKIPEPFFSNFNEIALRDLFQRLRENNYLDGDENTFVYIFGGRREIPENVKYVEVKIKNVDLIRLALFVKAPHSAVKWPILRTYCRRGGNVLKLYHSVLNQAETSESDTSLRIKGIVEEIKNKYGC